MQERRRKTDKRCPLKKIIKTAGLDEDVFAKIQNIVVADNIRAFRTVSRILILLNSLLIAFSYIPGEWNFLHNYGLVSTVFAAVFGVLAVSIDRVNPRNKKAVTVICYLNLLAMFTMSFFWGPVLDPTRPSSMFYVLLFALPWMITDLPARISLFMCMMSGCVLFASYIHKSQAMFIYDLIVITGLLALSIIDCFFVQVKVRYDRDSLLLKLKEKPLYDGLTRLFSKESAVSKITDFVANNESADPSALVIFDLDNFKSVNDNNGHQVGDQVLRIVGKVLLSQFRDSDILSRFGGDEFVVYLPAIATANEVERTLNRVHEEIKWQVKNSTGLEVSCSFGVAFFMRDGNTYDEVFNKADTAMYRSKRNGKSGISFYAADLDLGV